MTLGHTSRGRKQKKKVLFSFFFFFWTNALIEILSAECFHPDQTSFYFFSPSWEESAFCLRLWVTQIATDKLSDTTCSGPTCSEKSGLAARREESCRVSSRPSPSTPSTKPPRRGFSHSNFVWWATAWPFNLRPPWCAALLQAVSPTRPSAGTWTVTVSRQILHQPGKICSISPRSLCGHKFAERIC